VKKSCDSLIPSTMAYSGFFNVWGMKGNKCGTPNIIHANPIPNNVVLS